MEIKSRLFAGGEFRGFARNENRMLVDDYVCNTRLHGGRVHATTAS